MKKIRSRLFASHFILFASFVALGSAQATPKSSSTRNATGLYPVSGLDETLPHDDLRVLRPYLVGKDIIGLGETEHGTMSDQARLRILKYLIEEEGVRTVIGEFPDFASLEPAVQNYLSTCQGDPAEIAKFNYEDFQTQEFVKLLKMVCEHNLAHPNDPVKFAGSDNYLFDANLKLAVIAKMAEVVPDAKPYVDQLGSSCFGIQHATREALKASPEWDAIWETGMIDPQKNKDCLFALSVLRGAIDLTRDGLDALYGARYHLIVHAAIESLYAYQTVYATYKLDRWHTADMIRDQVMGQNFMRLHDYFARPGKAVMLLHNFHIAKNLSRVDYGGFVYVPSAAEWVRHRFGERYIAIGMTGYEVTSFLNGAYQVPTSEESLDLNLSRLPESYYLVDPRGSFAAARSEWFIFGSNGNSTPNGWKMRIEDQFDLLFYMRSCPASHPIQPLSKVRERRFR